MMCYSGSDIPLGKDERQSQRPEPAPLNCQHRMSAPSRELQTDLLPLVASRRGLAKWNHGPPPPARLASFQAGAGGTGGAALPPPRRAETHLHIQRVFLPGPDY